MVYDKIGHREQYLLEGLEMKKGTLIKLGIFFVLLSALGCAHTPEEARLKAEEKAWKESLKAKEKAEKEAEKKEKERLKRKAKKLGKKWREVQLTEAMDSWLGNHQSELIASWGPPSRKTSDGKGGTILIYEAYQSRQRPGQAYKVGNNWFYTSPQECGFTRSRMLYVDKNGYIYSWRWTGL